MTLFLLFLVACRSGAHCSGDDDCDGVPDERDRCAASSGEPTDAAGCTDDQMAGCTVVLDAPDDRWRPETRAVDFDWHGNCDVYLVQRSEDASFPAGRTRTEARTTSTEESTAGGEAYWRIVGALEGSSRAFTTEAREIRW